MECPGDCKNKHEQHTADIGKLEGVDKEHWGEIADVKDRIEARPKTKTIISVVGIFSGTILLVIVLIVGSGYGVNGAKIETEKTERVKYEQKNDKEHENLEAKFDAVKDAMHAMEKSLINEIQKIRK